MFAIFTTVFGWFSFIDNLIPAPLKKLAHWIMIGLVIAAVAFLYLKYKEHEAAQQALIKFNQAQAELTEKENKQYREELDKLKATENELTSQIGELNLKLNQKEKNTVIYIDRYKKSKGLDPIFNDVLKRMKEN